MARTIEIEGLGKRYLLGEHTGSYVTLREVVSSALPWRREPHQEARELWALRDVDMAVAEGEVLGVVGPNGAGKSTLLKILARITEPTTGVARTRAPVAALLDVGTGFHPELTGRENVFLNGALLGMTRRAVQSRFDDIVEFAGVERFLDTPLKRYSRGMYLRLAFAIAAQLEPEIVVLDEVLAVGDSEFQKRCLGKMADFSSEGRTVVFVSHDLGSIVHLCDRVVWLERGEVRDEGPPAEVVNAYLASNLDRAGSIDLPREGPGPAHLLSAALTDPAGEVLESVVRGDPFSVRMIVALDEPIPGLDLAIYVLDRRGMRVLDDAWSDRPHESHDADGPGEYEISVSIPPLLAPGDYMIGVWVGNGYGESLVDREALTLSVRPRPGDRTHADRPGRLVQVDLGWKTIQREGNANGR